MTIAYRAVWDDPWHNPILVLDDEFKKWCVWKKVPADDIPHRGRLVVGGVTVEVRRGDAEFGRVLRCQLSETDNRGRTWTVTATAVRNQTDSTYWVDVDCEDPSNGPLESAAPRLVRDILQVEGNPSRGPVLVSSAPNFTDAPAVPALLDLLSDQTRDLPVIVFAADQEQEIGTTVAKAGSVASALAGMASVQLLSPAATRRYNDAVAEPFRIPAGALRVFAPLANLGSVDDAARHRLFPVWTVRRHNRLGAVVAAQIAATQLWPEPPSAWDVVRGLVERPSEEALAGRVQQLSSEHPISPDDVEAITNELSVLRELLAIAEGQRDEIKSARRAEITDLRSQVKALTDEQVESVAQLEAASAEVRALLTVVAAVSGRQTNIETASEVSLRDFTPFSAPETIEFARRHLNRVVIPDEAIREIDRFERSIKDRVWAQTTWQALFALQSYAEDVAAGKDTGGFYVWCGRSGLWPQTKIAMVESETVMSNERLASYRCLPISTDVDASGLVVMQAHLKIQPGGGPLIPRLYFHDDTRGSTGCIHVGFYGPHLLMPNTLTN